MTRPKLIKDYSNEVIHQTTEVSTKVAKIFDCYLYIKKEVNSDIADVTRAYQELEVVSQVINDMIKGTIQ